MPEGDLVRPIARVGALTLCLVLGALGTPASARTSGGFAGDGQKVRFRDAAAFWDADGRGLEVALFPFTLSDEERAGLTHRDVARALLEARGVRSPVSVFASFQGAPSVANLETFTLVAPDREGSPISHVYANGADNPNWAGPKLDGHVTRLVVRLPSGARAGRLDLTTQYRRGGTSWQVKLSKVPLVTSVRPVEVVPLPDADWVAQPAVVEQDGWQTRELGTCSFYNQVAVDSQGRPHVAVAGNHELSLGVLTGDDWSWEVVAGEANWMGGPTMALALGSDDRPQLAYLRGGDVFLAQRAGDGWKSHTVASDPGAAWLDLDLDGEGRASVLIHGDELRLAKPKGRGFDTSQVAGEVDLIDAHCLAIDAQGAAHAAFERDRRVVHAWREGKSWKTAEVGPTWSAPSLAAGPDGRLHMTYQDDGAVLYRSFDGQAWGEPEQVSECKRPDPRVAVGADGSVQIAWLTFRNQELKHAARGADGWTTRTVPFAPGGVANGWLSLAVGPQGQPHLTLCWQHGSGFDTQLRLRHITRGEGVGPAPTSSAEGEAPPEEAAAAPPTDATPEPEAEDPAPTSSPTPARPAPSDPAVAAAAMEAAHPRAVARARAEVSRRAERWFKLRQVDAMRCRDCEGELQVTCKPCKGREQVRCPDCGGSGDRVRRVGGRRYRNTCSPCDGSGIVACRSCQEGKVVCETCVPAEVPGYRAIAGRRAFWDFLGSAGRSGFERTEHFAEVVAGRHLEDVCGDTIAVRRAELTRVLVLSDRVLTEAEVVWADGSVSALTTTWFKAEGRFVLATEDETPSPILE